MTGPNATAGAGPMTGEAFAAVAAFTRPAALTAGVAATALPARTVESGAGAP